MLERPLLLRILRAEAAKKFLQKLLVALDLKDLRLDTGRWPMGRKQDMENHSLVIQDFKIKQFSAECFTTRKAIGA